MVSKEHVRENDAVARRSERTINGKILDFSRQNSDLFSLAKNVDVEVLSDITQVAINQKDN